MNEYYDQVHTEFKIRNVQLIKQTRMPFLHPGHSRFHSQRHITCIVSQTLAYRRLTYYEEKNTNLIISMDISCQVRGNNHKNCIENNFSCSLFHRLYGKRK